MTCDGCIYRTYFGWCSLHACYDVEVDDKEECGEAISIMENKYNKEDKEYPKAYYE